jgi:hypothetical protein
MRSWQIRVVGLVLVAILGDFLIGQSREAWKNYWLMRDSKQGMATITNPYWGGHDMYDYRYVVDGREYVGVSYRDWQSPKYSDVQPSGEAVVYFSGSRPWLSLLYKPRTIIEGLPVLVVAFLFELLAVITVIRPKSKWAFNLSGKDENPKIA